MAEKDFSLVGHSLPREDGVARVTGREKYARRGQLLGVACRNPLYVRIPVNEVV